MSSDMAAAEAQVRADDRGYVFHSWSVQSAINPLPVAGGEGVEFWDYSGKRYLDFGSQLVNLNLGHQHPDLIAAIHAQADTLATIQPSMANDVRGELARRIVQALTDAEGADAAGPTALAALAERHLESSEREELLAEGAKGDEEAGDVG